MSLSEGTILKIAASILLNDEQTAMQIFWASLAEDGGSGPLDEDDVLDACGNWMDQLYANVEGAIADTIIGGLVEVWEVDVLTGVLTPIGDAVQTWVGLSANDALPNGVAAIGAIKTTNTKVTGRKFIPGFNDDSATDNNLAPGTLATLVLFVADWVTSYTDPNSVLLHPGVYSTTFNNFYVTTGVAIANAIVGYQRRRKPGVGS